MQYPLLAWGIQNSISFSLDMSGAPAIAVSPQEIIYFATIAKGTSGALTTASGAYNIVIGKISPSGTLLWMKLFSELITTVDEAEPSLVLGAANELYVAFTTLGSTQSNTNMANMPFPPFCNSCTPSTLDQHDVVVARIDETVPNTPTVTWVLQNNTINSCAKETVPCLAIDKKQSLLYLTLQTSLAVQCFPVLGSASNIFVACFGLNGTQLWSDGGLRVNAPVSANSNPVIAADEQGGLYIALEITSTLSGGADTTNKQVEVIKYQTNLSAPNVLQSYDRTWILSGLTQELRPIETGAISMQPTLVASPQGDLFIAFVTNGTIVGGTKVNANFDLVVAALTTTGSVKWKLQGPVLNGPSWQFQNCAMPYITRDTYGNIFLTAVTTVSGPAANIAAFKLNPFTGAMLWNYGPLNAYLLARSGFPNSLFPSAATSTNPYTKMTIQRHGENIIMAVNTTQNLPGLTHTSVGRDCCIVSFRERTYAVGQTPFTYMESKSICAVCSGVGCKCC